MADEFFSSDKINSLVEAISDSVIQSKHIEKENQDFYIYICRHGNSTYRIHDLQDEEYLQIAYNYDLVGSVAERLDAETIEELSGQEAGQAMPIESRTSEVDIDEIFGEDTDAELVIAHSEDEGDLPAEFQAAREIVMSIDEDVMDRFSFNLFQEISDPMVESAINLLEHPYVGGFNVSRKVFPNDDGFSLTEFNNSVQAVMSIGTFGSNAVESMLFSQVDFASQDQVPKDNKED